MRLTLFKVEFKDIKSKKWKYKYKIYVKIQFMNFISEIDLCFGMGLSKTVAHVF